MRIFGGEQISKLMSFFNLPEDQPLTHSMVNKAIESAQIKVEGHNFDTRKHLVDYDDVLNKQRDIVYDLRKNILLLPTKDINAFKKYVLETFENEVEGLANGFLHDGSDQSIALNKEHAKEVGLALNINPKDIETVVNKNEEEKTVEFIRASLKKTYEKKEKENGKEEWNNVVRFLFLNTIDTFFTEHLTAIDDLRAGINLRGYAQLDPLVQYKNEAFAMFEKLLKDIYFETIRRVLNIQQVTRHEHTAEEVQKQQNLTFSAPTAISAFAPPSLPAPAGQAPEHQVVNPAAATIHTHKHTHPTQSAAPVPTAPAKKLGRNDPCWCGSVKKFKKCHYPQIG